MSADHKGAGMAEGKVVLWRSMYHPEGHLLESAPIYDRTQALRRLPLLVKYLGPLNGDKKP